MILMIVTSSWSNINIRRLEKDTGSTGKEGFLIRGKCYFDSLLNIIVHCCNNLQQLKLICSCTEKKTHGFQFGYRDS